MAHLSIMVVSRFVANLEYFSTGSFLFNVDLDFDILICPLSLNIDVGTGASSY